MNDHAPYIDCDVLPRIPGPDDFDANDEDVSFPLKVHSHRKGGMLTWDPSKFELFFDPRQSVGLSVEDLHATLRERPVLNANAFDFLMERGTLIPKEWNNPVLMFFGTIFSDASGNQYILEMYWREPSERWHYAPVRLDELVGVGCRSLIARS